MRYFIGSIALATLLVVSSMLLFSSFASSTSNTQVNSACIAHRPLYISGVFYPQYTAGCTGHDEPELDPVSSAPGSARDLTWKVVLPADGSVQVSAVGPTFWFGGAVTDPKSLFGQAFVELQFYPDAIVTDCTNNGGFQLQYSPNVYSVCSPVWKVSQNGKSETAAFNAMLTDGTSSNPLLMYAGNTLTVHWFTTSANDGFHVTVTDLSTGHSGTIILNSKTDGPLMPAFDTQQIGNDLPWGAVDDTPNSFVWEIGHTSDFSSPAAEYCTPGENECLSYNGASWAGTIPIQILSVTFGDGSTAKEWAVVTDLGGKAEVNQYCASYGGPYCIYPWYTLGKTGFHYGVDFSDSLKDFGQANQFAQSTLCGGPFGPDTTYCDTVIVR